MRADIHDGSEHNTLQSEAGYIDARPHIRQIDETLLQRAAGPWGQLTLCADFVAKLFDDFGKP
jgi:hypothetical protein